MHLLFHGDAREKLTTLSNNSIDSIVTDPPYELGFMGKGWDSTGIAYNLDIWRECLRVLKPGGHLLSFGGSRTYHRMACAVEDAGFEIRDQIIWLYGQGFPKSLDIGKAIDRAAGATRNVIGTYKTPDGRDYTLEAKGKEPRFDALMGTGSTVEPRQITAPATAEALAWDGWGTALKPAHEPIVVARKPFTGTVANNVLTYGTGAFNIRESRIGNEEIPSNKLEKWSGFGEMKRPAYTQSINLGRFPANVIHDGSGAVLSIFPTTASGKPGKRRKHHETGSMAGTLGMLDRDEVGYGDAGSAARFFYCAKANKADRGAYNDHPTVKPTALMQYLVKLVTPPGGTVLDPFMGSGSTGKAAALDGFDFIGIDMEEKSVGIAKKRVEGVLIE